ncbi:MAG: PrgI family protein [Candidatus Wildermuthbacteria bacterium]|nr:PrgI family protein [Candidatus Wildermuthbacteria bacterium]
MRFQVPQFIDREARIIGPLTFKQFGFIGGSGAFAFVLYFLIPFRPLFLVLALILISFGLSLAFVRVNGRSFPEYVLNMLRFSTGTKIYVWKKEDAKYSAEAKQQPGSATTETSETLSAVTLTSKSKIRNLSSQVETQNPNA